MVKAGLKAIYLSGWQVAATPTCRATCTPTESLYPANSVPALARRLKRRAPSAPTEIDATEAVRIPQWLAPTVADAEAGFGGNLNEVLELMRGTIESGAASTSRTVCEREEARPTWAARSGPRRNFVERSPRPLRPT